MKLNLFKKKPLKEGQQVEVFLPTSKYFEKRGILVGKIHQYSVDPRDENFTEILINYRLLRRTRGEPPVGKQLHTNLDGDLVSLSALVVSICFVYKRNGCRFLFIISIPVLPSVKKS
jgi:hypothetical protein